MKLIFKSSSVIYRYWRGMKRWLLLVFFSFWHFILLKDFSELSEVVQKYSWMIILILSHFSRFETEFIKSRFSCQKEKKIRLTAEHDKFLVKSACWNIVCLAQVLKALGSACCPRVQDSVAMSSVTWLSMSQCPPTR